MAAAGLLVSLLASGPGLVTVLLYPDVEALDGDGNSVRRPGGVAVESVGRWQYLLAAEDSSAGQELTTRADYFTRTFPAGFAGRVTYDGRDWDVQGEPSRSGLSAATSHWKVRLLARSPRPVA